MNISIKRIYDPQEAEDGDRVLVDRIWPAAFPGEGFLERMGERSRSFHGIAPMVRP